MSASVTSPHEPVAASLSVSCCVKRATTDGCFGESRTRKRATPYTQTTLYHRIDALAGVMCDDVSLHFDRRQLRIHRQRHRVQGTGLGAAALELILRLERPG